MHDPLTQKMDMMAFIKIKTLVLWQTVLHLGENNFNSYNLTKILYPEYTKNMLNSTVRRQKSQLDNCRSLEQILHLKTAEMVNKAHEKM